MDIVYSPKLLLHETGQHPENKQRLVNIINYLAKQGIDSSTFKKPINIQDRDLLIVHTEDYLEHLKLCSRQSIIIGDNPFSANTFEIAKEACGAALKAAKLSKQGFAFALTRPPGHHAGRSSFEGFCYMNNIAYAVKKCLHHKDFSRVLIVDFDIHHGNGTQDIVAFDRDIFYLSLHQDPLTAFPYRYSSLFSKSVKNIILPSQCDDKTYLKMLKENLLQSVEIFKPDCLAISAGFDLYYKDIVTGNDLNIRDKNTFYYIAKVIEQSTTVPKFAVLEGGYYLPELGEIVYNFLRAFI